MQRYEACGRGCARDGVGVLGRGIPPQTPLSVLTFGLPTGRFARLAMPDDMTKAEWKALQEALNDFVYDEIPVLGRKAADIEAENPEAAIRESWT